MQVLDWSLPLECFYCLGFFSQAGQKGKRPQRSFHVRCSCSFTIFLISPWKDFTKILVELTDCSFKGCSPSSWLKTTIIDVTKLQILGRNLYKNITRLVNLPIQLPFRLIGSFGQQTPVNKRYFSLWFDVTIPQISIKTKTRTESFCFMN